MKSKKRRKIWENLHMKVQFETQLSCLFVESINLGVDACMNVDVWLYGVDHIFHQCE